MMPNKCKLQRNLRALATPSLIATSIVLLLNVLAYPVDKLEINYSRQSEFLPYSIFPLRQEYLGGDRKDVARPVVVYQEKLGDSGVAVTLEAVNRKLAADSPDYVVFFDYNNERILRQSNVYFTISNMCVYHDPQVGENGAVVLCYQNDSAYAVRLFPDHPGDTLFLTSGVDRTGNGEWVPGFAYLAKMDYDYDGKEEIFFYLTPSFDMEPRVLFCLEPETFRIEWSLPVASHMIGKLYSCNDSLNPSVIFISYGPQNGVKDMNFDDTYGYVTKVNKRGEILFNKIATDSFFAPAMIPTNDSASSFYLFHQLPLIKPERVDKLTEGTYALSEINQDGVVVRSTKVKEPLLNLWIAYYQGNRCIYSLSATGIIRIYTTYLQLISESNQTDLIQYMDTIRLSGQINLSFIFRGKTSTIDIYSHDLQKLATWNESYQYYEPIAIDARGNVTQFILSAPNRYLIGEIQIKKITDYIKILFWEYQSYILMCMSAFVVGLVVMNYYRRKARKNLNLISLQKRELERVYKELKEAQARIIAQEKYQQAKDIAGGVAHEIHNALCPALNSLDKLRQLLGMSTKLTAERNEVLLNLTEKAIVRAINMTDLVSAYSRLESEKKSDLINLKEIIEEVIDANKLSIQELGIFIKITIPEKCIMRFARIHAYSLFNNLITNALDALVGVVERRISIIVTPNEDMLTIEFSDTGVGIEQGDLNRIFDAFYSTKPQSGTGLGLTIVKKIVELYSGQIDVESTLDKGTKFIILFTKQE
jgi:signal transduction histidine kinase